MAHLKRLCKYYELKALSRRNLLSEIVAITFFLFPVAYLHRIATLT